MFSVVVIAEHTCTTDSELYTLSACSCLVSIYWCFLFWYPKIWIEKNWRKNFDHLRIKTKSNNQQPYFSLAAANIVDSTLLMLAGADPECLRFLCHGALPHLSQDLLAHLPQDHLAHLLLGVDAVLLQSQKSRLHAVEYLGAVLDILLLIFDLGPHQAEMAILFLELLL